MPPIQKPGKLRRAAGKIAYPLGRAAYLTKEYAVKPIAELDSHTEKLTDKAVQKIQGEVDQRVQQTDTGQAASLAVRATAAVIKDVHQYHKSKREFDGGSKLVINLDKYSGKAQREHKDNLLDIRKSAAEIQRLESIRNAAKAQYFVKMHRLDTMYRNGTITQAQYQSRVQRLKNVYTATLNKQNQTIAEKRLDLREMIRDDRHDHKLFRIDKFTGTKIIYEKRSSKNRLVFIKKTRKSALKTDKKLHKTAKISLRKPPPHGAKPLRFYQKMYRKHGQKTVFRQYQRSVRAVSRTDTKLYREGQKIRKYSKPQSELPKNAVHSLKSSLRSKAAENADGDEGVQAAMKLMDMAESLKKSRAAKLQTAKKRVKKLQKKSGVRSEKLKQRQKKLHSTSLANQQRKKPPRRHRTLKEFAKDVRSAFAQTFKSFAAKAAVPLTLVTVLCFSCMGPVVGVLSAFEMSAFMLGTYNVLDKDLTDAEEYYTKLMYDANAAIVQCGSESHWKNGLRYFGVDVSGYHRKPAIYTNTSGNVDYDVWKVWAYLCAACYKFDESAHEVKMWKFNDTAKTALNNLFKKQYEFKYRYSRGGHWHLLESSPSGAMGFLGKTTVGNGDWEHGLFTFENLPDDIKDYAEVHRADDGTVTYWLHYELSNHEILNMNDPEGFATATGWYMVFDNDLVAQRLCKYQHVYDWINETELSYGLKQVKSLDNAIKALLNDDKYQYYEVLTGGTQTESGTQIQLYGGHQVIGHPTPGSLHWIIDHGYIQHGFGYTTYKWGEMHCGLETSSGKHEGIDIVTNANTPVYAMFKGKITNIGGGKIELSAADPELEIRYWIDEDETTKIRATYENVSPAAGLSEDSIVEVGTLIGYTTDSKKCGGHETNAPYSYLHIKTEIKHDTVLWKTVDPILLIEQ